MQHALERVNKLAAGPCRLLNVKKIERGGGVVARAGIRVVPEVTGNVRDDRL